MLTSETEVTGKPIFKKGVAELRKGLIDVQGVLGVLQRDELTEDSSLQESTIEMSGGAAKYEKKQWKQALDMMRRNPALVLDAVPTVWDEHKHERASEI